jgi:ferritin-like metal-binding protein YciE
MAEKGLDSLFSDMLKDIYYAEQQILKTLPELADAASTDELKAAFKKHYEETEGQVKRLDRVFELLGSSPSSKKCDGIEGILKEGDTVLKEFKGTAAADAGLIASAQAVEHYEITRYGTLRRWAQMLGLTEAAELLGATLEEESRTDELLTKLADAQANVKATAAAG